MALDDLIPGEKEKIDIDLISHLSVDDLVNIYGEEVTRRGLQYMNSLIEADESYRESAEVSRMEEGYSKFVDGDSEKMGDVAEEWARGMEDKGLGFNGDEDAR